MTREPRFFPPDFERLAYCPVCDAPTITRVARLKLYLGAKERCHACMAGWKFTWGRWLYHLPIFVLFVLAVGAYILLDVSPDGFVVIGAVVIEATIVPLFLPIEARLGDRLTNHAIRRIERSEDESASEAGDE